MTTARGNAFRERNREQHGLVQGAAGWGSAAALQGNQGERTIR